LLTKEEMVRAIDMGNYFRIPIDSRNLNYEKYIAGGDEDITNTPEYHSHNALRLTKEELDDILLSLDVVKI
jgi:UDP-glucose 4-epimerase